MVNVREATPIDDPVIGELLVEAYVSAYASKAPELDVPEWRKAELRDVASRRPHTATFVAELEEKGLHRVVGTIALYKPGAAGSEAWLPGYADLRLMATLPALHGRGLSKAMLDHAEAYARDVWRCPGISLHVRQGVQGLVRLYEGRGYKRAPEGDIIRHETVVLDAFVLEF